MGDKGRCIIKSTFFLEYMPVFTSPKSPVIRSLALTLKKYGFQMVGWPIIDFSIFSSHPVTSINRTSSWRKYVIHYPQTIVYTFPCETNCGQWMMETIFQQRGWQHLKNLKKKGHNSKKKKKSFANANRGMFIDGWMARWMRDINVTFAKVRSNWQQGCRKFFRAERGESREKGM